MTSRPRVLILGSGYAGQGHALAFREAGAEIVGMASRTEAVVRRVAAELSIPVASTDWRAALQQLRPDIVAVATPGGSHVEMISAAVEAGCHVFADKPLAVNAVDAESLYRLAAGAGVKTAYAASYRYQPQAYLARRIVDSGRIGPVLEVECVSHYNWPRNCPFGWPHRLDQGGGRLNNNFTHKLAIVLHVVPGVVLWATGETRNDLRRAPIGPRLHDFRQFTQSELSPEELSTADWAEVDSDWSYTVLCRIGASNDGPESGVSATFRHSCLQPSRTGDYVAVYGERGQIHIEGAYATGDVWRREGRGEWTRLDLPQDILDGLPAIPDNTLRNWTQLAREFLSEIRGEGYSGYPTFLEGWHFQGVIDAARTRSIWSHPPLH